MPDERLGVFAACAPGLEPWLLEELEGLGVERARAVPGGIEFDGDWASVYRVNLGSSLAICVLVRIAEFRCARLPELRRKLGNLEWGRWLGRGCRVRVRARAKKSKLYHSGAIEQRAAEALAEVGCEIDDESGVGIHLRIEHNVCQVSIDTSGAPLHRRGWRLASGKAPLREDLAAALVRASGWTGREGPLVDPFTGSGTIAIEAAANAQGLAPGRLRSFAFEHLVGFDESVWSRIRNRGACPEGVGSAVRVFASDRDAGAVRHARENAERAGVVGIGWERRAFRETLEMCADSSVPPGVVVCNPPYGVRLDAPRALRDLYAGIGHALRAARRGWRLAIVSGDVRLVRHTGLKLEPLFATQHGGLRIAAWSAEGG
ncbi:MAG: class I SAM-dependent RNA methyltransferase [Planctomycetes bacterium]|nr:class I SAM-dependent RNA methyltransferase [Planctomycetota bacterium]